MKHAAATWPVQLWDHRGNIEWWPCVEKQFDEETLLFHSFATPHHWPTCHTWDDVAFGFLQDLQDEGTIHIVQIFFIWTKNVNAMIPSTVNHTNGTLTGMTNQLLDLLPGAKHDTQ